MASSSPPAQKLRALRGTRMRSSFQKIFSTPAPLASASPQEFLLDSQVGLRLYPGIMNRRVLRTSDLANRIGVQPEAIRYYERRGLLPRLQRGAGGYRIYTPEHLERVEFIKKCQTLGFSLDEIRELVELKFLGTSPCQHVRDLLLEKIKAVEDQIARLEAFRHELQANVQECEKTLKRHVGKDDCCPVLERLGKEPVQQEKRKMS